jgi:hypothetical protein
MNGSVQHVWMHGHDLTASVAENYRAFAEEASYRSPVYAALATGVAGDGAILRFVESLPPQKRQPNLLFAAARYLLGDPVDTGRLRDLIGQDATTLAEVMLARLTQTNEPARCATLLPALAQLPGPVALIEVGASAGLMLLIDKYSYDYAGHHVTGRDPRAPILRCAPRGPVPLPAGVPEVAWRAGLDVNPLDVTDEDDVRWLSCMVWPGEGDREQRLAAAIAAARRDPPVVHRGDLVTGLPALAAKAPAGATLVVYHSAALAYIEPERRGEFAAAVRDLRAVWLSNEPPGIVPDMPVPRFDGWPFVLGRDGRTPLALADGHGNWLQWLPDVQV